MEKIEVIKYGHELWNRTMLFAASCSWRAGSYLAKKMAENDFESNERVIALSIEGELAGFCTFANKDELPPEYDFTPFIGFVFVDEKYRGRRLSEKMINVASQVAKNQGYSVIYVMSGEIGLYEKYGFEKIGDYKTVYGSVDQLFYKRI